MQELKSKHKEAALGEWSDLAESCQNRGPSPANAKPARKKKPLQGWCADFRLACASLARGLRWEMLRSPQRKVCGQGRLVMGWVNGTRASCQVAPGTARRADVLCVAYLDSSSTSEITRQGWHPALRYRTCSLQPWPCKTLVPGNVYTDAEQRSTSTRSVSCQASPFAHHNGRGWRGVSSSRVPSCLPSGRVTFARRCRPPDLGGGSQRHAADIINLQRFSPVELHLCRPRGTCSHAGKSDPSVA